MAVKIEVIQFGTNPLAGLPNHPNEVSLTLDDALEMVHAIYGVEVNMEIVQDPTNEQGGTILLDPLVVLQNHHRRSQRRFPVQTRPEYHALVEQMDAVKRARKGTLTP